MFSLFWVSMPYIQLFYLFFFIDIIVTGLYFLFLIRIFNLLKKNYPDKYKELGEPSLWWNNSPRNGVRVLRFLFSKDPIFSTDEELLKSKRFALFLLYAAMTIFVVLIILFFLFYLSLRKS